MAQAVGAADRGETRHDSNQFSSDGDKMKKINERDIERYLVKRVKELGGEVRKVQWIGRRGAPDRLVMLPRRAEKCNTLLRAMSFWIELKAPGVAPEAHQVREHDRMRNMGQHVAVVDSFERVDEVLA